MSAREIIAREVSAGCNTVDWERGRRHSVTVDDTRRHPCGGERNRSAKLTEEQAREIKRSREPLLVLAARYDVSIYTVHAIRTRKRWKHL